MSQEDKYVRFKKEVVYRGLEKPHLFNVLTDELYELEEDGLGYLGEVDGTRQKRDVKNTELLEYSESEGLLEFSDRPAERKLEKGQSPVPSLRYLELILTRRCSLKCRHCYLGEAKKEDLSPELLTDILDQFDRVQGLRLLLSGGEPLMYPHLDELARAIEGRGFRTVLLTNGQSLDDKTLSSLPVHEVQVSLDGMERGHDIIRGQGAFRKALEAAKLVAQSDKDLSIATMIHSENFGEVDVLEKMVHALKAREWSLEFPTFEGRWKDAGNLAIDPKFAADIMDKSFGGSYHGGSEGRACGLHLAAVTPEGGLCYCGFHADDPLGDLHEVSLAEAWSRKEVMKTSDLEFCADCRVVDECGGGCRYRAGGTGPDLVMCAAHGWPKGRP